MLSILKDKLMLTDMVAIVTLYDHIVLPFYPQHRSSGVCF
ncbi:hypothetical protein TcasGA2_TC032956 [Tribolium castaneum]|uniref:Uncharacterized protein n=1 Tax=Tribolium castaneum TaxID=7070 RepID=A0A139WIA5_TRICA|nr:hypothetical protein TcasGA2_TC032956 [Tribolium castaneum]